MDRKHTIPDAGILDSLAILRNVAPQVGGPNLDAKLTPQED